MKRFHCSGFRRYLPQLWLRLIFPLMVVLISSILMGQQEAAAASFSCPEFLQQNSTIQQQQKTVYKVGVLSIRGIESGIQEYNATFGQYLTHAVNLQAKRFDPPLQFEMVPVLPGEALDVFMKKTNNNSMDFVFANPSMYSCVESEIGAHSLVTMISKRIVNNITYQLQQFGGVIFTRNNASQQQHSIETLSDIRGKRVAAVSITGLGSGQMQFRELQRNNIHHLQDPKQLIFMQTQDKVVNAVLNGQVDVGFVRTDQLERSIDSRTNRLLDLSTIKIIQGQALSATSDTTDNTVFPFVSSTPLYPEWNVASLTHVSNEVAQAVQTALLDIAQHASIASALLECLEEAKANSSNGNSTTSRCTDRNNEGDDGTYEDCILQECFENLDVTLFQNCDSTPELALLAHAAMEHGRYAGFRTTLSYMSLRNMQEEIGFINTKGGQVQCTRSQDLTDAVVCPEGHFKREKEDIATSCESVGLDCYGYQCLCQPCVKAFDVDFAPHDDFHSGGCSKFVLCGSVEQAHRIVFRAADNREREDANVTISIIDAAMDRDHSFSIERIAEYQYEFEFDATERESGILIVEVKINDEQISQSPFRLQIFPRDCESDTGDALMEPDSLGNCVCVSNTVSIFGSDCIRLAVLLPSILLPIVAIVTILVWRYVRRKKVQADALWRIQAKELLFPDSPRILGRGTFGLVLLAHYRGTPVAVKRVLPPPRKGAAGTQNSQQPVVSEEPSGGDNGSDSAASFHVKLSHYSQQGNQGSNNKPIFDFRAMGENAPAQEPKPAKKKSIGTSSFALARGGNELRTGSTGSSALASLRRFRTSLNSLSANADLKKLQQDLIREMRLVSRLRHPCITTVMGAVISPCSEPMLVLEYMQLGSLYDLLHNESVVIEGDMVLPILRDIASGLRFLHAATPQIIHRDLKAQNILVDSKFRAKVADFGLSQKNTFQRSAVAGTPFWLAPELLRFESGSTASSDVYAFGIVLWEVYQRKEPYEREEPVEVLRLVADKAVNKRPPCPESCPSEVAELMRACWTGDPEDRPSAEDIDVRLKMLDADSVEPGTLLHSLQRRKNTTMERTEAILNQLFPPHVASALSRGQKVEPESIDRVTVCFSDIVGYTAITGRLSPEKVSNLLERLYNRFDELCGVHSIFKIETVGDAYMSISNLIEKRNDHVRCMARFALDCVTAASETLIDEDDPDSGGYVEIRVGFSCGPVVAHVVGTRMPKYSIFGDTVNVAARMESTSEPGRVQCSESCAEQLQDSFPITATCRGKIPIKGKGKMTTYWVDKKSDHRLTIPDTVTLGAYP